MTQEIEPLETAKLLVESGLGRSVEWEVHDAHPDSDDHWRNHSIGVRDSNGFLIGYGGLTVHPFRAKAELSKLAVHPDHRHKGIGIFLVKKRVLLAQQHPVREIFVDRLEDTNTLEQLYYDLGFSRERLNGRLVRGVEQAVSS